MNLQDKKIILGLYEQMEIGGLHFIDGDAEIVSYEDYH